MYWGCLLCALYPLLVRYIPRRFASRFIFQPLFTSPSGDGCMIFHLNRSISVFNYLQWRLVCSKSTLGFLTSSIMFLGWLFGNIIFGILSDKYGRRKILFFSSCLVCWVAFVSSFVPWYWMYATLRFIIGFGLGKPRDDKFATLETRLPRGLEPICIPQWFLGLLLWPGQSAISQFFSLSLVTLQEVFAKIYSSQFSFHF